MVAALAISDVSRDSGFPCSEVRRAVSPAARIVGGGCCFDYGNVETDDKDDGADTMEALYFGGGAGWGHGGGNDRGPWRTWKMEFCLDQQRVHR